VKKTILFISIVFVSTFFQAQEETIALQTSTGNIEGTLLLPTVEKPTIALIIAGSGPTDRDGNSSGLKMNYLKMLAEGLYENNIASIRYDKRGIGASVMPGLKEDDLTFSHFISDAELWMDKIMDDSRFGDIVVIGHSEGSLIGMIASQNKNPNKFISIAGPGITMLATLRRQLKDQPPYILSMSEPILEKLEKGQTVDSVPPLLNNLFRESVQNYLISVSKYDPAVQISKLKCPVMIVQGTTDIQIEVLDAEKLAEANTNSKLLIIEGMNHILKEAPENRLLNIQTYGNPDLKIKEGLVDSISKYILE
tara:strand:+ start:530 stop:1456 length:927 start_codon:yes stop_codon:yes gene_type:complete